MSWVLRLRAVVKDALATGTPREEVLRALEGLRTQEPDYVAEQLDVGRLQILVLALVLPGEEVALPDVGEADSPVRLDDPLLERVLGADRVGFVRRRLAEHPAEVDEVGLGGGLLGGLDTPPLGGERGRRD